MQISLEHLSKKYNREWIFKDVNYQFHQGESYAITGANGSGKSTLIKIISGAIPANSGKIGYLFQGSEIENEDIYRYICMATPYMELVEEYTLTEMINFHFKFKTLRSDFSENDIIDTLYLNKSKNKYIKHFSSGMKQRLKLGLTFFSEEPIILLDEPTTNLDSKGIDWYLNYIDQIKGNKLLIIASNQEYEYDFCNQYLEMENLSNPG